MQQESLFEGNCPGWLGWSLAADKDRDGKEQKSDVDMRTHRLGVSIEQPGCCRGCKAT